MSGTDAFARGLVGATVLAGLAPLALLALGPFLGSRTALWSLLAAAAAVALARSAAAQRARSGRGVAVDALVVLAAVAFGWWLAAPGLLGAALALWGFGLVLSLRPLLPCLSPRAAGADDAFETARARALALLEEEQP